MKSAGDAGCTAMDVLAIRRKKRQDVTGFAAEGCPKVYEHVEVLYRMRGRGLDGKVVERAIELSRDRYCPVMAMVKGVAGIETRHEVEREAPEPVGARGGEEGARMHLHAEMLEEICSEARGVDAKVVEAVVVLAVEIAREGREGRKIGTLFVVGDSEEVMRRSRPLILDPLAPHPESARGVLGPDARETVKELAQLDGAFVVSGSGVFVSATRYVDAVSHDLAVPLGLGGRHMAAASITKTTGAVAVVVSESSMVRVFDDGALVAEIMPELWMLDRHGAHPHAHHRVPPEVGDRRRSAGHGWLDESLPLMGRLA